MQEFYRIRELQKGMSKVEALRQAQLALLRGTTTSIASGEGIRAKEVPTTGDKEGAKAFVKDPKAPFKHPYYWAPFILIGNSK